VLEETKTLLMKGHCTVKRLQPYCLTYHVDTTYKIIVFCYWSPCTIGLSFGFQSTQRNALVSSESFSDIRPVTQQTHSPVVGWMRVDAAVNKINLIRSRSFVTYLSHHVGWKSSRSVWSYCRYKQLGDWTRWHLYRSRVVVVSSCVAIVRMPISEKEKRMLIVWHAHIAKKLKAYSCFWTLKKNSWTIPELENQATHLHIKVLAFDLLAWMGLTPFSTTRLTV
jgi:hypothetical protein